MKQQKARASKQFQGDLCPSTVQIGSQYGWGLSKYGAVVCLVEKRHGGGKDGTVVGPSPSKVVFVQCSSVTVWMWNA